MRRRVFTDAREVSPDRELLFSSTALDWPGAVLSRFHLKRLREEPYCYSNQMVAVVRSGRGRLEWRCDRKHASAAIGAGTVSIQPAHRFWHTGEMPDVVCDTLNLDPVFLGHILDGSGEEPVLRAAAASTDSFLVRAIDLLAAEIPRRAELSDAVAATELIVKIGAHLLTEYGTRPARLKAYQGGLPKWRLAQVCDFVDENLGSRIHLKDLAIAAGGMSLYYFCRLFQQSLGLSPHQFVTKRRLARARELLEKKDIDITEVAVSVGFCDHSHLTRRFRQYYGRTPSAFRDR